MQSEQASKLLERIYLEYEQWGESCRKTCTPRMIQDVVSFSFMRLCIGIPVGMARLSVVARLILVYGWLPSPFSSLLRILYFTRSKLLFFLLICESRVVSCVESCLHIYLFIKWLLHVDYLIVE